MATYATGINSPIQIMTAEATGRKSPYIMASDSMGRRSPSQILAADALGRRSPCIMATDAKGRRSPSILTADAMGRRSPCVMTAEAMGRRSPCIIAADALGRRSPCLMSADSMARRSPSPMMVADAMGKKSPNDKIEKKDCELVGMWKNELNSHMNIQHCKDGQMTGWYNREVGDERKWYPLVGRYTVTTNKDDGLTKAIELGWTVSWNNTANGNSNSVTTWSGIYYPEPPTIHTQWILTAYVPREQLWNSATINHDTFTLVG